MSLLKKKRFGKHRSASETDTYIDLGKMSFDDEGGLGSGAAMVKVAEVYNYEDVYNLTSQLYSGHLLVIDYNSIAKDTDAIKRIHQELRAVADEIGGDVAAIGNNMLMVTPKGISIDRTKIRGSYN